MIRIGIIEDDYTLRKSMEAFIEIDDELDITFSFSSVENWQAEEFNPEAEPEILLLDLGLPGLSGIDVIALFKKRYTHSRIIVITGDGSPDTIWTSIANGADGYISKPFSLKDLKEQIAIVQSGGAMLSPLVANTVLKQIRHRTVIAHELLKTLTKREREVVEELIKGFSYKEVSHSLNISSSTVNDHLKNIYQKLGVKSKSELIAKILIN